MRVKLPHRIMVGVLLIYPLTHISHRTAEGCTIGVASGKATADGRPLLWGNDDEKGRDNDEVVYLRDGVFSLQWRHERISLARLYAFARTFLEEAVPPELRIYLVWSERSKVGENQKSEVQEYRALFDINLPVRTAITACCED